MVVLQQHLGIETVKFKRPLPIGRSGWSRRPLEVETPRNRGSISRVVPKIVLAIEYAASHSLYACVIRATRKCGGELR
jgi:hypothetical protein